MAATNPPEWPLGDYIATARKRAKLSMRGAATRAGLSLGGWQSLEQGRRSLGEGQYATARNPGTDTIVAAARAIGADPREALRIAGHDPDMIHPELSADYSTISGDQLADKFSRLPDAQRTAMLALLDAMLDPGRDPEGGQRWGIISDTGAEQRANTQAAADNPVDSR